MPPAACSGTYSGVSSNFAFLTPSLSYDANNVFLTLALQGSTPSRASAATRSTSAAVGTALDASFAGATGDFATVIGALAGLSTAQGPAGVERHQRPALCRLRLVQRRQQRAVHECARPADGAGARQPRRRPASGAGRGLRRRGLRRRRVRSASGAARSAASAACRATATPRHVHLQRRRHGRRHRLSREPRFLLGLSAGYTNGTQWVDSFQGKGWSNSGQRRGLWPASRRAASMPMRWRATPIPTTSCSGRSPIPGLQPRTANGQHRRQPVPRPGRDGLRDRGLRSRRPPRSHRSRASRPRASTRPPSANGAPTRSASTWRSRRPTSLRTTLGADLAAALALGDTRTLDIGLRLGWLHEYADTARPITAAFAGAPSASFTVYGATPQRDARGDRLPGQHQRRRQRTRSTCATTARSASGTDNHTLNLGVRLRW